MCAALAGVAHGLARKLFFVAAPLAVDEHETVITLTLQHRAEAVDRDDRCGPRRVDLDNGLFLAERDTDQPQGDTVLRRRTVDRALHCDARFRERQQLDRHDPRTERAVDLEHDTPNIRTQRLETELALKETDSCWPKPMPLRSDSDFA